MRTATIRAVGALCTSLALIAAGLGSASPASAQDTSTGAPPSTDPLKFIDSGPMAGSANGMFFDADDNLYIANVFGQTITKIDPETGDILEVLGNSEGVFFPDDVTIGPDGTLYWTEIAFGAVMKRPPGGPSEPVVPPGSIASANPITLSETGRLFVAGCYNAEEGGNDLVELDPVNGGIISTIRTGDPGCASNAMDWKDGHLYSPRPFEDRIVTVDVETGELTDLSTGYSVPIAVKFNSEGVLHAGNQGTGEIVQIDIEASDTANNRTVIAQLPSGWVDNIAFDSNDRLFVSSASDGAVVEVLEGGVIRTVIPGDWQIPSGVAVIGDTLYTGNSAIIAGYDKTSAEQTSVYRSPFGVPGSLPFVTGIDARGDKLILTSWFSAELAMFDPTTNTEDFRIPAAAPLDALSFGDDVIVSELAGGTVSRLSGPELGEREVLATLALPTGLAASGDDVYVGDAVLGQVVQVIDDGVTLETPKIIASNLGLVEGIAVDGNSIFLVDGGSMSLKQVSISSGAVTTLQTDLGFQTGAPGFPPFAFLNDVAIDDGTIYINADRANAIWQFDLASPAGDVQSARSVDGIVVAADYDANSHAEVLRLYQAMFGRTPDLAGAKYWIDINDSGFGVVEIAGFMSGGAEFSAAYAGTSNAEFVDQVYTNVLGREFDQEGYDYWLNLIETGQLDRAEMIFYVTANAEFISSYPFQP